jgi:Ribulose 1,5-bisphosphate carboxylase, large subunit
MSGYRRQLYSIPENLNRDDFIFAKYIVGAETEYYMKLAAEIDVEQTTGTWEKVPQETDELVERHGG